MSTFPVIPVMDLKGGVVVRGIAGQRASYQPIVSQLAADAAPRSIARGLIAKYRCQNAYIADLDAIAGATPAWQTYESIAATGLNLIIDAGIRDTDQAALFSNYAGQHAWLQGVVVALESIESPDALHQSAKILGPNLAVFSLDMKHGQPITMIERWRNTDPATIVDELMEYGFRRIIVLDLAAVGVDQGPATLLLCRSLRDNYPFLEIISGGGVRDRSDIESLIVAGCNQVLVASALHDGRLKSVDGSLRRRR